MGGATPIQEPSFDPVMHDPRHVIDVALESRRAIFGGPPADAWRASSLGYCYRRQYLERAGVEGLKSEDDGARILWLGDVVHRALQGLFRDAGLMLAEEQRLVDPELNLSCHVDMIWGGTVQDVPDGMEERVGTLVRDYMSDVRSQLMSRFDQPFPITLTEIKSAAQYSAEKMYTDGPSVHHKVQAGANRLLVSRNPDQLPSTVTSVDRYQLLVVAKSDAKMLTFPVFDHDMVDALDRVKELNHFWLERQLPPCTCGEKLKWEPRYCKYRDPGSSDRSPRCCDVALGSLIAWEEDSKAS